MDRPTTLADEIPDELGPCSLHGRINCLECYDIDPENLDAEDNLITVDGQEISDSLRNWRNYRAALDAGVAAYKQATEAR